MNDGTSEKPPQGPERRLVGEPRSGPRQAGVEEAQPGKRGVGEILELSELLRLIDRRNDEARENWSAAKEMSDIPIINFHLGESSVLIELRSEIVRLAEERSDLSNAGSDVRRAGLPNQTDG